jgi:electron transfer flavoprotein beta subunit
MRILVCVKQVYDPATVRISRSREELDLREAVKITNPADRYALEAALQLREAIGGEVIAVTVGDRDAEDTAHEAVAIGADRATLILGPNLTATGGGAVARAIGALAKQLGPVDVVLTGQTGGMDGGGALAPRLAALLDWPVALDVVTLAPPGADGGLEALAADESGAVTMNLSTPFVAAIAPGPERPRYPHPARIANAWREGLVEICTSADLGLDAGALVQEIETGGLVLGPERTRGELLGGTADEAATALVEALRNRRIL